MSYFSDKEWCPENPCYFVGDQTSGSRYNEIEKIKKFFENEKRDVYHVTGAYRIGKSSVVKKAVEQVKQKPAILRYSPPSREVFSMPGFKLVIKELLENKDKKDTGLTRIIQEENNNEYFNKLLRQLKKALEPQVFIIWISTKLVNADLSVLIKVANEEKIGLILETTDCLSGNADAQLIVANNPPTSGFEFSLGTIKEADSWLSTSDKKKSSVETQEKIGIPGVIGNRTKILGLKDSEAIELQNFVLSQINDGHHQNLSQKIREYGGRHPLLLQKICLYLQQDASIINRKQSQDNVIYEICFREYCNDFRPHFERLIGCLGQDAILAPGIYQEENGVTYEENGKRKILKSLDHRQQQVNHNHSIVKKSIFAIWGKEEREQIVGAGFRVNRNGKHYIVTCAHLVEGKSEGDSVTIQHFSDVENVKVKTTIIKVGTSNITREDICLLELPEAYQHIAHPVSLSSISLDDQDNEYHTFVYTQEKGTTIKGIRFEEDVQSEIYRAHISEINHCASGSPVYLEDQVVGMISAKLGGEPKHKAFVIPVSFIEQKINNL